MTTNLNINFLSKPVADADLLAHGRLLKLGRRLAVVTIEIEQQQRDRILVAYATSTYSIPPQAGH